jgi:tetratricopeptide (TPR) repeat protein
MHITKTHLILLALLTLALAGCRNTLDKANTCLKLGDYPLAVELFSREVRRNPQSFAARLGLGKALLQQAVDKQDENAWRTALIQMEAAQTLAPAAPLELLLAQVWFERTRLLLARGDTTDALNALSRALEHNDTSVNAINLAAIVYFQRGEAARAEILFNRALALDSANAVTRYNTGMVCWAQGKTALAQRHWLAVLKANPRDADAVYWFAVAEKKLREEQ